MENILKESIKNNIVKLLESSLVTPFNLVENARLENYEYVNFYKKETYLVSEMKIEIFKQKCLFYYYFDEFNKLQKIDLEVNGEIEELFSREAELEKELNKLKKVDKKMIKKSS